MRRCYTLAVIDRATGRVRTATFNLRGIVCSLVLAASFPVLVGLGATLSAAGEVKQLRTRQAMLNDENASYRSIISAFTEEIRSLDAGVDTLPADIPDGRVSTSSSEGAALTRARAAGGTTFGLPREVRSLSPSRPDEILGSLQGVLKILSDQLPLIERTLSNREALAAATPSIWPARGWLTAAFGVRSDPFTGEQGFHQGIDISTAEGQPAYATADGIVESAAPAGDYGNLVVLKHGFGLSTRYGHLCRFAVAPGARVNRGDVIGYVGSTGRSTGSHVHYEILVNGRPIDPLQILTVVTPP
jgi:murein DD-endopeptidase MepM/ murein hydrolase activator NlpD